MKKSISIALSVLLVAVVSLPVIADGYEREHERYERSSDRDDKEDHSSYSKRERDSDDRDSYRANDHHE